MSRAYRKLAGTAGTRYALSGGEDYELLFCARKHDRRRIEKLQKRAGVTMTRIGICDSGENGIVVLDAAGNSVETRAAGHDHFKK